MIVSHVFNGLTPGVYIAIFNKNPTLEEIRHDRRFNTGRVRIVRTSRKPNLLLMYRCHCKTMIRTTCCHRSFIKKQRSVGDDLETIARLLTADGMRQPT